MWLNLKNMAERLFSRIHGAEEWKIQPMIERNKNKFITTQNPIAIPKARLPLSQIFPYPYNKGGESYGKKKQSVE